MWNDIWNIVLLPILGILTAYVVSLIQVKMNELKIKSDNELHIKYVDMLTSTICDCVLATKQTYVDTLKAQNKFDKAAQEEAFKKTLDAVLAILSEDAKEYLTEAFGDLNEYITQNIEAQVISTKK